LSESFIVVYGIKLDVGSNGFAENTEEIELLETALHPLNLKAKTHNLDTWYGNFAMPDDYPKYSFLIGRIVGVFGAEFENDKSFDLEDLILLAAEVKSKLPLIGISTAPKLLMLWEPDN
jgi:hypothetical protein